MKLTILVVSLFVEVFVGVHVPDQLMGDHLGFAADVFDELLYITHLQIQ
jgi:hypothetical protein